jgi:hypothetical protein
VFRVRAVEWIPKKENWERKLFYLLTPLGVNFKTGLLAGFSEGLEEVLTIDIIEVEIFLAVSPAHDVIDGSWIFDSELARHEQEFGVRTPQTQV